MERKRNPVIKKEKKKRKENYIYQQFSVFQLDNAKLIERHVYNDDNNFLYLLMVFEVGWLYSPCLFRA